MSGRIRGKAFLITLKSWIDFEELYENVEEIIEKHAKGCEFNFAAVHEIGDETCSYKHTHYTIYSNEVIGNQAKNAMHTFCFPTKKKKYQDNSCGMIHNHIKPMKGGKKSYNDAVEYFIPAPGTEIFKKESIGTDKKTPSVKEIITGYGPGQGNNFIMDGPMKEVLQRTALVQGGIFNSVNEQKFIPAPLIHKWQIQWCKKIIPFLMEPRKVGWLYNKGGGAGKGDLIANAETTEGKKVLSINWGTAMTHASLAKLIVDALDNGSWTGDILFLNIPKKAVEAKTLYVLMENVKDGKLTHGRYTGGNKRWHTNCAISVFSNELPQTSFLSTDRWCIWGLDKIELDEPNPLITKDYLDAKRHYMNKNVFQNLEVSDDEDLGLNNHECKNWMYETWKLHRMSIKEVSYQREIDNQEEEDIPSDYSNRSSSY